jgi:hypothetical protein
MKGRNSTVRSLERPHVRGRARTAAASLALGVSLTLAAAGSHAGILRDVMIKMGVAKPEPPAGSQTLPRQGFACCVLHYKHDWISDSNYAELPIIPAGTPMEVVSYGDNRAYVKVDGKPMRLGHEYGRNQEKLDEWVDKIVVKDDPRVRIATYPAPVQEAIRLGKVMVGMTHAQAIAAVGYPMASENVSLDAPTWRIWRSSSGEYDLNFGADGRIKSITGEANVTSLVVYQPGR